MKTLALVLAFCACALAQTNTLNIIPNTTGTAVGTVNFWDLAQTNYSAHQAPSSLGANQTITDYVVGSAGCVGDNGAGVQSIVACSGSGLVPPVTLSGATSSPILTLTQSGSGSALTVNGLSILNGDVGIDNASPMFPLDVGGAANFAGNISFGTDNLYQIGGPSLSPAVIYSHQLSVSSTALFTGLVAEGLSGCPPCTWEISGGGAGGYTSGASYFQDVTSRYVFNSAGDVAQTGTASISSGGVMTLTTGGPFDLSFAGGQVVICTTGAVSASCGALYLVGNPVTSSTTLNLPGWSGGTVSGVGWSYLANAFQTSLGTMYCTGTGFCYFQNLVVTDGFTSYAAGSISGTATCVSTLCTWQSGGTYNPSMNGGFISIGGTQYTVSAYQTNTQFTLTSSCSGTCTAATLAYTSYPFLISNHNAFIDPTGLGYFHGGLATDSGSNSLIYIGSVGNFYNRTFTGGAPSCSGVGDGWQGVNTATPALWFCAGGTAYDTSSGGGVTSVSGSGIISSSGGSTPVISCSLCQATMSGGTGVTLTGGGSTINIGQAVGTSDSPTFNVLTVSSCVGCGSGGGLTSFQGRTTAAAILTKADVTGVDQALASTDSPTFAGLSLSSSSTGAILSVTQAGSGVALLLNSPATTQIALEVHGSADFDGEVEAGLASGYSGTAFYGQTTTGHGVEGFSTGSTGQGIYGHNTGGGQGGYFANAGSGIALYASLAGNAPIGSGYSLSVDGPAFLNSTVVISGALTVGSCSGCGGGGVTSVGGSGLISSSGGATPTISCSSCQATISGGTGVNLTGGGSTINIGQAVGTSSNVTFNSITTNQYAVPGWNFVNSSAQINASLYSIFGTAGVNCSGTPSGAFQSSGGIVTHC